MEIRELYNLISMKLDLIDFSSLWTGFHRFTFALYDEQTVYFKDIEIPYDNRFIGNTTIDYQGEKIAIWNITNEQNLDIDIFASNIIHEMFHCYQHECGDKRYPNDLVMLDYPDNLGNFSMKYKENKELVKGLDSLDSFNRFASIRRNRINLIGDIIEQEFYTETIEGLAEYVGTMALKQLSTDKYNKRVSEYSKIVTSLSEIQFDIRRISYFTGTLFYIALFNHGYELNKDLSNRASFFNQFINTNLFILSEESIEDNLVLVEMFKGYVNNKQQKIDEFMLTHTNKIIYYSFICGYDPMNMIKFNNMILCTHFIMLKNDEEENSKFIKGPILLILKNGSNNIVDSYLY